VTLDDKQAGNNFVKGLADQAVDKLFKSPLQEEAMQSVAKTLSTLPGFTFHGFARDGATPSAAKDTSKNVIKDIIRNK
jgi:hypothetical protein